LDAAVISGENEPYIIYDNELNKKNDSKVKKTAIN
jgi:hypothetical protein